jgi:hypothetical protein
MCGAPCAARSVQHTAAQPHAWGAAVGEPVLGGGLTATNTAVRDVKLRYIHEFLL